MTYKIVYPNELNHYGVKGMRWGVRKDRGSIGGRYNRARADSIRKDIQSFKGHEDGIRTKKGKLVLSSRDIKNMKSSLHKQANMYEAKADYKDSKKQYSKDFYKWYNKSIAAYSPSKKHRRNNDARYTQALVSAGDMAIKKGKYLQAKGVAKNNPKLIKKGKYQVKQAKLANDYYRTLLKDINSGKSWNEASKKHNKQFEAGREQQIINKRDYKQSKKG